MYLKYLFYIDIIYFKFIICDIDGKLGTIFAKKMGESMNISIAIVDTDRGYVERLSEVLQHYEELSIHIYTSGQKFQEAMRESRFDIVLFDPDAFEERIQFIGVKLPICLYSDDSYTVNRYENVEKVAKYQRISSIYKDIIRKYADKAGYSFDMSNEKETTLLAVYSPIGGSGKTTIALALASQIALLGKKTLFLSLEQMESSSCVNEKKEDGLIRLVEIVYDEKVNFGLKCKAMVKEGIQNTLYIEGFDRLADYQAVTEHEMTAVIQKIQQSGVCDVLVVDMESFLDSIGQAVMELADRIIVIEKSGELASAKMKLFSRQVIVNQYKKKMLCIRNFVDNSDTCDGILDIPVIGKIHHYGNLPLQNILHMIQKERGILLDQIMNI